MFVILNDPPIFKFPEIDADPPKVNPLFVIVGTVMETASLKDAPPFTVNVGLDGLKKLAVVLIPTFPLELKEK